MLQIIKEEISYLYQQLKSLDKKVVIIFLSVAVLQTISWYYSSRKFFRMNVYPSYSDYEFIDLVEYLFWFLTDFATLLILPVLIILFLLKDKPKDYGFRIGNYKYGLAVTIISMLIMLPILWIVSSSPEFLESYPHLQTAKDNWTVFIIYEAGIFCYLFAWEFIWRGFMLFGLEEKFGFYAVFIQMIPFVILHNGKPELETFSAILGGIALGILALRTRSFIYGFIIHFIIMFGMDIFSTLRYKVYYSSLREAGKFLLSLF